MPKRLFLQRKRDERVVIKTPDGSVIKISHCHPDPRLPVTFQIEAKRNVTILREELLLSETSTEKDITLLQRQWIQS